GRGRTTLFRQPGTFASCPLRSAESAGRQFCSVRRAGRGGERVAPDRHARQNPGFGLAPDVDRPTGKLRRHAAPGEGGAMSNPLVLYRIQPPAAIITLNRPDKRNALSRALIAALIDAFQRVREDQAARCVILTGAGSVFCAGMDLAELAESLDLPE